MDEETWLHRVFLTHIKTLFKDFPAIHQEVIQEAFEEELEDRFEEGVDYTAEEVLVIFRGALEATREHIKSRLN